MRMPVPRPMLMLALLACLLPLSAGAAGSLADVSLYDREAGRILPVYVHAGQYYVAGEPGHEYEIRLRSQSGQRLLAVTSVDGVNVITGATAAPGQSGYVLDAYGSVDIAGWRKSLERVAAFYFTKLKRSYAARTGRPENVGVIGVALFRERQRCCWPRFPSPGAESHDEARAESQAPAAAGAPAPLQERADSRLGTGHGRSRDSAASYTGFERASDSPDEIVTLYYDSARNLAAAGIIPPPQYSGLRPQPFPGGFVPDP